MSRVVGFILGIILGIFMMVIFGCAPSGLKQVGMEVKNNEAERLPEIEKIKKFEKVLKGHRRNVYSVAFSPDGRLLASGSDDATVRIWRIITKFYYAQTMVKIKKDDGRVVSLPPGTLLIFLKNSYILPVSGTLISGKTAPLYESKQGILIFKDTPLKPYPSSKFSILTIPAGTIIKKDKILLTSDRKYAWVNYRGVKGFISTEGVARIEPVDKPLALVDAGEKLRLFPGGDFRFEVPLGAPLRALYYCPYFDAFFVSSDYGKGWVSARAVKEIHFKPVKKVFVALRDVPVRLAYFVNTTTGYLAEGEEVFVESRVSDAPYYFVKTRAIKGYVPASSLKEVEKVNPVRLWVQVPAKLLQAPSPSATPIGDIPQYAEVKPLKKAGDFYLVEVLSTGQKGWVQKEITTAIKPDLYKPFIRIVKKKKQGREVVLKGLVADDTKVKALYINGEPVVELKPVRNVRGLKLPFKAEDIKSFTYRVYIPEGYPNFEMILVAEDRDSKTSRAKIWISGEKVFARMEKVDSLPRIGLKERKGVPKLSLSVGVKDENGNNLFEGREWIKISIVAKNLGTGVAKGVKLFIKGGKELGIPEVISLGNILPDKKITRTYRYRLAEKIGGVHELTFRLQTVDGFISREKVFRLTARDYEPPNILFDYALRDANGNFRLEPEEGGTLYVILKNVGGDAKNVKVRIHLPEYVKVYEGKKVVKIPRLPSGEETKIKLSIIVPGAYARTHKEIPINVEVTSEEFNKSKTFTLTLNEYVQPPEEVVLKPKVERPELAYVAASDVDRKVKELKRPRVFRKDAVALVIGIGSYKNLPPSIYSEFDGILMKNLFEKVYRIKAVSFINDDATYLAIKDAVTRLCGKVAGKGVYVFYSGHGFPKEGKPGIVPYDAPKNLSPESLISLSWIVSEFKKAGAKKVVVLADACYSGYTKEGVKLAEKARPALMVLKGFSVGDVFVSATSKEGKSYSDRKLRHGIFTYFVAKGLLFGDKNGDRAVEVKELREYLKEAERYARSLGYTDQKPFFEAKTKVVIRR